MKQDKKSEFKVPLLKRIKYFITSYEKKEARFLDYAKAHPEKMPAPSHEPSLHEFDNIITTMEERGIEPVVIKEMKKRRRYVSFHHWMRRPATVLVLAVLLVGGTTMGVNAKKSYDFRMRVMDPGKDDIVWNNDQDVFEGQDKVDQAYLEIEEKLGSKPLKMFYMPFNMRFENLLIVDNRAKMTFSNNGDLVNYVQSKYSITASNNTISDRKEFKEVENTYLNKTFTIFSNKIGNNKVEFSTSTSFNGFYYYIDGVLSEDDFTKLIEWLSF